MTARYYINDSGTAASGTYGIPASDPQRRPYRRARAEPSDRRDAHLQPHTVERFALHLPAAQVHRHASRSGRKPRRCNRPHGRERRGVSCFHDSGLCNARAIQRQSRAIQTPILDHQILDAVTWQRGRHAFKFGGEFRAGANDEIRDRSSAGKFHVQPAHHRVSMEPAEMGSPASCLGQVNSATIQVSDKIPSRASYWAFTSRMTGA